MADLRFNLYRRRIAHGAVPSDGRALQTPADSRARVTGHAGFPAPALVDCIPGPALVVNERRQIEAINAPLCDAFGLDDAFLYVGEPFADFACRTSLTGGHGLLALGSLLSGDSITKTTDIVAANGVTYRAQACRAHDGGVLITLSDGGTAPGSTGATAERPGDEIALNIVNNLPGALLRLVREEDGRTRCIFAGPHSPHIFGRGIDEITTSGNDFRDVFADWHRRTFEEAVGGVTDGPQPVDIEVQVRNAVEGLLWVRCVGVALPGADGPTQIDIRVINIEGRRKVLEERRQLQNLLDMVVDNIPLMVSVRDAATRSLVIVNRAYEEISGRNRRDIIGKSEFRLFPEIDTPSRAEQERILIEEGRVVDLPEARVESPSKGSRIVKSRKYPLFGEEGEVRYLLSITEDVTEQRTAENALRRSEQRFRDAIESVTDGIALFDRDQRLVLSNRRYRSMWPGFDAVARPGVTFESLIRHYLNHARAQGHHVDIETAVAARLARYRNPPSSGEVPLIDGRWLQVADRLTADGGVVVTCSDITALKEREAGLRHASQQALDAKETAEEANRSKSDFLANMSHELRTPLNAVIGFSEIIKDALLGDDSIGPYRGYAHDIYESGRHLLALINDILDMSKIEAGKLELCEEPVDIVAAVQSSLRLVRERAERNRVTIGTDLPDGLPHMRADLRKVKQIVINLLSNAVKFTPAGGSVTACADVAADGTVVLQVVDTGIGINKDDVDKVLAPFGQAEAGLNRQYEGTGLGLTLTKALTELHGGRLEIESRDTGPQTGTTVTVILPASRVIR